jgi:phosphoribosylaminoimidazole carboxylase/phosphoribosylaminoimidazole-succinocarboxamide synthase
MTDYVRGNLISEGKTKRIWEAVGGEGNLVVIENKSDITAFDDSKFTRQFASKADCVTATTCRVFELLETAGIPTAYVKQISSTEFVAKKCKMIPLEAVARRYAVGSYLKRNPQLTVSEGAHPFRFHRLVIEFFLKTTKGKLTGPDGEILVDGLDPKKGEEDPLILNPREDAWKLVHPKKPRWDPEAILNKTVLSSSVLGKTALSPLEDYLYDTFLVLEGMFSLLGHHFIDLKLEFGITSDGQFCVADVVDNDSWRLRDIGWKELSKEAFRQGEELGEVERKYGVVTELVSSFRAPDQCLVLWRGSEKDEFPRIPYALPNVKVETVTASGHKAPRLCTDILEKLQREYSDGAVIVAKVGLSNGLGPLLAARTSWPVISIPAMAERNPEDLWSSLRMPSLVPMAVIYSESNAIDFALRILAQRNPFIYRRLQREVEKLDN